MDPTSVSDTNSSRGLETAPRKLSCLLPKLAPSCAVVGYLLADAPAKMPAAIESSAENLR